MQDNHDEAVEMGKVNNVRASIFNPYTMMISDIEAYSRAGFQITLNYAKITKHHLQLV